MKLTSSDYLTYFDNRFKLGKPAIPLNDWLAIYKQLDDERQEMNLKIERYEGLLIKNKAMQVDFEYRYEALIDLKNIFDRDSKLLLELKQRAADIDAGIIKLLNGE